MDLTLLSWGDTGWLDEIALGVVVTIALAVATAPLALVLGFASSLARTSDHAELRLASRLYTTVFRALPELVTIFLIFFGLIPIIANGLDALALRIIGEPIGLSAATLAFLAGWLALGLTIGAYASEVFTSAFRAIPRGQYEGAYAIGLRPSRTLLLVIAPQVFRVALPGLSNLWVILLKDTALVSTIALNETLRQVSVANRVTKEPFLFFGVACLIYLVLTLSSSAVLNRIDERMAKADAR